MSSKIPVPNNDKTKDDPFYRYKRDILNVKTVGSYNVLTNLNKICTAFKLDVDKFIAILQKKVGCKFVYDKELDAYKTKSNLDKAESYFELYLLLTVVCVKCMLPECFDNVCNACGHKKSKN